MPGLSILDPPSLGFHAFPLVVYRTVFRAVLLLLYPPTGAAFPVNAISALAQQGICRIVRVTLRAMGLVHVAVAPREVLSARNGL